MRTIIALAALLAAMLAPWPASAQRWGPRDCPPVGGAAKQVPAWEWRTRADDPGRFYLYRDGKQAGGWDPVKSAYRSYDAATDTWGPIETPPWERGPKPQGIPIGPPDDREKLKPKLEPIGPPKDAPPQRPFTLYTQQHPPPGCIIEADGTINCGVERNRLAKNGKESWSLNGVGINRATAMQMLTGAPGAPGLPDDAQFLRLTVIGSDTERAAVLKDLDSAPELAALKGRLVVQAYAPGDWALRPGFVIDERPTIYLETPDGKVLHPRAYTGPALLAASIRKADPSYDPSKDPDLTKLVPARKFPWPDLSAIPGWAWALAICGVIIAARIWSVKRDD